MTARPMRTEEHHSSGGLVVESGRILLISTRGGRRWQLPKGHIEPGESEEQAAVREIREETGVDGSVLARLPHVEYWFVERGVRIHKRVEYFLLAYVGGDASNYDRREVSGAAWFPWHDGIAKLSFDNERRVAEAALEVLEKQLKTVGAQSGR
jgi:8-oxo-dGTP pyrophosphatase MutT (NUDIX family)